MKDERLLITFTWFRDNWCGAMRLTDRGNAWCHITADPTKCSYKKCQKWADLKEENRRWLADTKEITSVPLADRTLPLYTVQKCRALSEKKYGAIHYAECNGGTLCGKEINQNWWILTTAHDGIATCKKCLAKHNGR